MQITQVHQLLLQLVQPILIIRLPLLVLLELDVGEDQLVTEWLSLPIDVEVVTDGHDPREHSSGRESRPLDLSWADLSRLNQLL